MAEIVRDRACCSNILVNSKRNNEVSTSKMCKNYEKPLNEALDELNSVQTINRLLQNELLTYTAHKSTWGIELHPTEKNSDPDACSEWTLANATNRIAKSKKRSTSEPKGLQKWIPVKHTHSNSKRRTPMVQPRNLITLTNSFGVLGDLDD